MGVGWREGILFMTLNSKKKRLSAFLVQSKTECKKNLKSGIIAAPMPLTTKQILKPFSPQKPAFFADF